MTDFLFSILGIKLSSSFDIKGNIFISLKFYFMYNHVVAKLEYA